MRWESEFTVDAKEHERTRLSRDHKERQDTTHSRAERQESTSGVDPSRQAARVSAVASLGNASRSCDYLNLVAQDQIIFSSKL